MSPTPRGFTTLELTVVISFLFIVCAVLVFFVDPVERAKQKRDDRILSDSREVLDSLSRFYISFGRLPWSQKVDTRELSPALSWKPLRLPEVGICADDECSVPGELIVSGKLNPRLLTSDTVWGRNGQAFIAKGPGPKSSIYACFVPEAKATRRNSDALVKINLNLEFPKSGTLASCPAGTTWVEEDVCYRCIQR